MTKFAIGDTVIRRPRTLGANGERGKVLKVERTHGGHQMVTVQFANRAERFIDDTYVKPDDKQ